jgi:hypothetical protein
LEVLVIGCVVRAGGTAQNVHGVGECDILIAVIGKGWVEARGAKGNRRLDDPDDFVRIEIESALNNATEPSGRALSAH